MKPPKQAYSVICVRTSKNLQTPLQGALCRTKRYAPGPACPGPSPMLSPPFSGMYVRVLAPVWGGTAYPPLLPKLRLIRNFTSITAYP